MKQLMAVLLIISLPLNSFAADCVQPVKQLEQGEAANCSGFLFSPQKELELRIMKKQFDVQTSQLSQQDDIISKLTKKNNDYGAILTDEQKVSELWRAKAIDSTTKYIDSESNRQTRDWMFLGSGILLTVLAGWSLGQVHK